MANQNSRARLPPRRPVAMLIRVVSPSRSTKTPDGGGPGSARRREGFAIEAIVPG